ncbi:hypothetical protein Tco_0912842 [Tanacetum coccineum]
MLAKEKSAVTKAEAFLEQALIQDQWQILMTLHLIYYTKTDSDDLKCQNRQGQRGPRLNEFHAHKLQTLEPTDFWTNGKQARMLKRNIRLISITKPGSFGCSSVSLLLATTTVNNEAGGDADSLLYKESDKKGLRKGGFYFSAYWELHF